MAKSADLEIIQKVVTDELKLNNSQVLCLQWCKYKYDYGTHAMDIVLFGKSWMVNSQAAKGQARIPSLANMNC